MHPRGTNKKKYYQTRHKLIEFHNLFFHQSDYGFYCGGFDKPLPIKLPIEKQEEHLLRYAYLADCNSKFAQMYGYDNPNELIGIRFPQLFIRADTNNMENLRTFLKNGYQIKGIICHETGKNGTRKYFLNDVIGVVEDGHLVRVWGMQQDITEERSKIESEKELLEQLTSEQSQILKMTIDGKTMKEIAAETGLSFKTVEFQRNRLRNVFKVDTIAQLIAAAIQLGVQTIEI